MPAAFLWRARDCEAFSGCGRISRGRRALLGPNERTSARELRRLLEGPRELEDVEVLPAPADDLQADGQTVGRETGTGR